MSNFWVLSTNEAGLIPCIISLHGSNLASSITNRGGWGLGYYDQGEILLQIEPKQQGEILNASKIVKNTSADLAIMHTREATVGSVKRENTHPFRFDEWLFAHNGTVPKFDKIKNTIMKSIPAFIQRGIKGDTDSEFIFHLFLSFLYDENSLSRPDLGTEKITKALRQTFQMLFELINRKNGPKFTSSAVVSDGYSFVVLGYGIKVFYKLIEGIKNCNFCRTSLIPSSKNKSQNSGRDHNNLKSVLVCSDPKSKGHKGFTLLDDKSFIAVDKNNHISFCAF